MKLARLLLAVILCSLALVACGNDATITSAPTTTSTTTVPATTGDSTPTASASGGLTMKKAFGLADPQVKAWKNDAVYVSVFNPEDQSGMDAQGQALQWYFEAIAPGDFSHAFWLVKSDPAGQATVSKSTEDTLTKDRGQPLVDHKLPAFDNLIDSDKLMAVAAQNGGNHSDRPVGARLAQPPKDGDPLAFDLVFYNTDTTLHLRIDAQSGKLLDDSKG